MEGGFKILSQGILELNGESVGWFNEYTVTESPTAEYYDIIEQGYKENGLDMSYLETALAEVIQSENLEMEEQMQMRWEM